MSDSEFSDFLRQLSFELASEKQKETETKDEQHDSSFPTGSSSSSDCSDSSLLHLGIPETPERPVGPITFTIDGEHWYTDNDGVTKFEGPGKSPSFKVQLIGFCEEFYHENFRMPSPKELQMRFRGHKDCPQYLHQWPGKIEDIREFLENRGIDLRDSPVGSLDPRFVSAVHLVLNYQDKRSAGAKLKGLQLRTTQWTNWLKKPEYREYYRRQCENIFTEEMAIESKRVISEAISAGDLSAVKYYNEITGIYRPQESATQNTITVLMAGLFEILARYLPQEMIARIGAEIREAKEVQRVMGAIEVETHVYQEDRLKEIEGQS